MERLVFSEKWEDFFAAESMWSFEDFFNYAGGKRINKNKKRDVIEFKLGESVFFMKRFYNPHLKDMFFTLRSFASLCSQGRCEWENANTLLAGGVDTYHPVCYGEQTIAGIERNSVFVTEAIKGQCLTDFVAQKWLGLSQGQREKILVSLGQTVRRIHDAKICLPDMYVWHFFLTEAAGDAGGGARRQRGSRATPEL